jgi:general secretion pathway protein D
MLKNTKLSLAVALLPASFFFVPFAPTAGWAQTTRSVLPTPRPAATTRATATRTARPAATQISLNFKDAPIDAVLEHLSQAAGFVVLKAAPVDGRVTVMSKQPVSPEEAITLLNAVLKLNGYTAVQMGRILKIVSRDAAKKGNIPVFFGADPADIQPSDNLITQVIPIRSVDAVKLKQDLQPLVSTDADLTANAGSNTIMITDTAANIRRVVEIISNIDKRDSTENTIIVKHLTYADATSAAKVITDIFKVNEPAPQNNNTSRFRFSRGPQQANNAEPQGNIARVTASADPRTNTVVVTGPADTLKTVQNILDQLDRQDMQLNTIRVKHLQYADATSAAKLITDIFNDKTNTGQSAASGNSREARFFRAMSAANGPQEQSAVGRISASADSRTNTIVISGPSETLKVVDDMLNQLDANPTAEQTFFFYAVKNGQSQNMANVLNSLFGVNTGGANPSSYRNNVTGSPGSRNSLGGRSSSVGGSNRGGGGGAGGIMGGSSGVGGGRGIGGMGTNTPIDRAQTLAAANVPANVAGAAAELVGQVYVVADADTNSLLVATAGKYQARVLDIIKQLDRPVPQVLIKVLLAEVTHENDADFGVDFSILNQRASGNGQTGTTNFNTPALTNGLAISVVETNVNATLRALARENKLDVLSRPYILASNNQLATITVGQVVPIVTNTRVTDTGQTINSITYQDIGIILNVTPHINPDGLVILDVAPEISQLTTSTIPISENLNAPVFDLRSADSRVGIKDGQTIVIGGLMEDKKTTDVQKVPLLGDIPLVGMLFKRTVTQKTKTELLIFLTPHVAQSPDYLKPMSEDEMEGTKLTPNAVAPGVFQEQMRGMKRGAVTQPTTAPAP